jgi:hypothetical protein
VYENGGCGRLPLSPHPNEAGDFLTVAHTTTLSDMTRRRTSPLLVTLVLAVCVPLGCEDGDPAQFDGQSVREWIAQAKAGNTSSRVAALRALRAFPGDKDAIALLERVLSDDAAAYVERLAAAQSLYRATGKTDKVVPQVGQAVRKQADASGGNEYLTKDLEELVFWLGVNARPLIPDIEYARSKVNPRLGPGPAATRAELDRILRDIPKT